MEQIYWLMLAAICLWCFFALRKTEEKAQQFAQLYCQQHQLQFISIAKLSAGIKLTGKGDKGWQSIYALEFSGDGESSYTGEMRLINNRLASIDLPPYRTH